MQVQNKRKIKKIKIASFLLIIALLIYIPAFLNWMFGKDIKTEIIRIDTIEDSINSDCYFIRDEAVLNSPLDGKYISYANEGEKVPANHKIATVLKDSSAKLLDDMKELDLRIVEIQKEKSERQKFFSDDISKIEDEIAQKVKTLVEKSAGNNLMETKQVKDEIDKLVEKKAEIIGNAGTPDANLESIKKEKQELQEQINSNTGEIISEYPGIVSYFIDGYEEALTPKAIKDLTPQYLENIKVLEPQNVINKKAAAANKPFAKIIKSIDSYIVGGVDSEKEKYFQAGDGISIRINDIGKVVDGTVDFKSEVRDGKFIAAVKIDQALIETEGYRKANVDFIIHSYKGLKVPMKSLMEVDLKEMKAKILLVKANYASIKDVKIVGNNADMAIIENIDSQYKSGGINLYDSYVVDPQNIQDGQLIN